MIDLDANATTPLSPAARDAMIAAMARDFANPSSIHGRGQAARAALEQARQTVMQALGGIPGKLVWTSGATEANALAWNGVLAGKPKPRVVTTAVEHPSILALAKAVQARGGEVVFVGVDAAGQLDRAAYAQALQQPADLVSVMAVQNELGVIYPVAELAAEAHDAGALFHTDATQAPGRIPVDAQAWQVDLMSVSAHKAGGPPGTGALWLRRGVRLEALVAGHQEDGLRGGTENVVGAIGMAAAFGQLPDRLAAMSQLRELRDALWRGLQVLGPVVRNGPLDPGAETGHVLNVAWPGLDGARMVRALDLEGVAVSSGAACASGTQEPSHVLVACGQSPADARCGVRFSLSPGIDAAQIPQVVGKIQQVLTRVLSPT